MIDAEAPKIVRVDAHHITPAELQQLGMTQIAYVKPIMLNGAPMFAIHGADGSPMAVAEDRDMALAAIVEHEMIATLVH